MPISLISKSVPPLYAVLSFLQIVSTLTVTYCRLSIIIFLWTPKGFISPEPFLNFLLNLYISPWLRKSFKFIVIRLLQIHLRVNKLNLFNFTHPLKQNSPPGFDNYPQAGGNCPFHLNSIF